MARQQRNQDPQPAAPAEAAFPLVHPDARGIRPGRDFAVTGFDDIPEAALAANPRERVRPSSVQPA